MTGLLYTPLIIAGLAAVVWGLPASHRLPRPMDTVAALVVLLGIIATVIGILLTAIPDFFKQ
ncbi:hypothetical protein [Pelotalea chapellei]|uniref:Uncharacterized protein n=1 Tax=Pelotalea chapellei TaxID=44671 RepID=A0ABS5UAR1_9BACT|nr:hypothetical protein [Pelotalea chapellei]MBT1072755.1 hypothetical protein [Pelotalea chapellei]